MSKKYFSLIILNIFLAFFLGTINAQEDTSSYTEPKVNPIKLIETPQTAINEPLLNEFLTDYVSYSLNYEELYKHIYSNNYFSEFKLTLNGKDYLFALQRNDLRSQDFKSATNDEISFTRNIELNDDEEIQTFKGFANGKFENYIRVSVSKENFWGYVYDKELDKFIYFQSVKSFLSAEDIFSSNNNWLVFDLKNLKSKSNSECAVIKRQSIEPRGQNEKCLPTYVEIATDADVEFFNRNSNNVTQANNRIRGLLNQMEGLYSANFNTMFILTFQNVNTSVIPQLSSTDAVNVLLPSFETFRNTTWTSVNRDIALLFSGKRLQNGVLGVAYTPGVCRSWHYSVISENSKTLLTANHEVGHLFNAQHDPVSDCGNASTAPIMCPSAISNIMRFSTTSINEILGYMSNQTCLNNFNSNLQSWAKTWTNERNSRWIGTWFYQNGDQKLVGDFDGDGDEELLFMSNSTWCNMLDYSCDIGSDWYHMWSNMGNRCIGTWFMNNGDKHYTGDFNGDGITDLLSISNSKSWATIGKYNKNTGSWSHLWSNMGNHWISGWYVQNGDDYKIADFDGDGKDELLCLSSSGWAMLLDFDNGTFNVKWHNNGNSSIGGVNANSNNRYIAGRFATTNQKELLTWVNNWVTLLRWNNSTSSWQWIWSQYGVNMEPIILLICLYFH